MPRVELNLGLTPFQLPTTASDTEEKATGMIVYNLAANAFVCPGLYVWDGSTWNRLMGEACPPYITPITAACPGLIYVPPVHFMDYNLGADPSLNTPKKQMEYLATEHTGILDARVYGGLYQWGRKDLTHGASTDGTYKRYTGSPSSGTPDYHSLYQRTDNPVDGIFYLPGVPTPFDWRENPDPTLWGNGESTAAQDDDNGGVSYDDGSGVKYYQNTDWIHPDNDPCPEGFRVPTLDEWERLIEYDCPTSNASMSIQDVDGTDVTWNALTWVPVVCNHNSNGQCIPYNTTWNVAYLAAGYAIYSTAVWKAPAADEYKAGTIGAKSLHDPGAPDPILFLPANANRFYGHGVVEGIAGYYWTATVNDTGRSFIFSFNNTIVRADNYNHRANGNGIRCVSEK
jgi:hypothetical protein